MIKKLKIQSNKPEDNYQTPTAAVDILLPYLNPKWTIWECAWGKGKLVNYLRKTGFQVVGNRKFDFLHDDVSSDCIITNPPYSKKEEFLKRSYELGRPFAFLMPLTALEGRVRGNLYRKYGIQLIIPNRRINFEMPSGKGSGAWFATAWYCYKLNLPQDLLFVEMEKS